MVVNIKLIPVMLVWLLITPLATAQDGPMPIFLEVTVEPTDSIGSRIVYLYRENIRQSSSMTLTAIEGKALLKVSLITMDPTDERASSVYSATFTMRDLGTDDDVELWWYINSSLGSCGSNQTSACAETLAARTSEATETVREILANVLDAVSQE